jgi:DNA-binding NtrC family response regulator
MQLEPGSNMMTVLAVSSSPEDQAGLRAIFTHSRWRLCQVESLAEAISFLEAQPIAVVICDDNLRDGTFRDVLELTASRPNPFRLIVASHFVDNRLWAEALNLGAYDVLAIPFRAAEVFHCVSLAWRRWKDGSDHTDRSLCTDALPRRWPPSFPMTAAD